MGVAGKEEVYPAGSYAFHSRLHFLLHPLSLLTLPLIILPPQFSLPSRLPPENTHVRTRCPTTKNPSGVDFWNTPTPPLRSTAVCLHSFPTHSAPSWAGTRRNAIPPHSATALAAHHDNPTHTNTRCIESIPERHIPLPWSTFIQQLVRPDRLQWRAMWMERPAVL